MSLTNNGKEYMLDQLAGQATRMRLLDELDEEILDHGGASQDKELTWGSASGNSMSITNQPEFEIPADTTVAAYSYRSTDGVTEYGRDVIPVAERETYTGDGRILVESATITIADG